MKVGTKKVIDRLISQLQYAPNLQVGMIRREIRRLLVKDNEDDKENETSQKRFFYLTLFLDKEVSDAIL